MSGHEYKERPRMTMGDHVLATAISRITMNTLTWHLIFELLADAHALHPLQR